jgi:osmotically-inducible protein OsmY
MTMMVALSVAALACGDRTEQRTAAEAERMEAHRDMDADRPDVATRNTAPTASDQPENEMDRELVAAIRQHVMEDDSLSMAAQNVTIVSEQGHVTLRGQVATPDEKSRIEIAARQAPGAARIDNQIEVAQ